MRQGRRFLFLLGFGVAVAVDLGSLALGFTPGHVVAKPVLMPVLAAYAYVCDGPRLLVVGLLCGWGGDVLLRIDAESAFLAGMGCFAAGHGCYLLLFRRYGTERAREGLWAGAYGLALVAVVCLLWPDLPAGLRVPVAGYSLLLTAMADRAGRLGSPAAVGGALFLLSDTLIATGVAKWPQLPRPDLWIMLTYLAAQYLLSHATLRAHHLTSGSAPAVP
ncbi:lysoplasmalogenase [Streptomyces tailanensis]|uniref:lysoplasmalogenase n=1 Tax=Streptomyces tailanensis TaxID=2569858 RepID=UPI00122E2ED4|nr:lysoplasmalogenase [Streptomyces tailanensis]